MPEPTLKEVIAKLRGVIGDAFWIGLTEEQIRALIETALLERKAA